MGKRSINAVVLVLSATFLVLMFAGVMEVISIAAMIVCEYVCCDNLFLSDRGSQFHVSLFHF